MAYWLFREKGWTPTQFLNMPYGERQITRAFFLEEIEEIKKREEELDRWRNSMMRS